MTKSTGDHPTRYARGISEENCSHHPEAHVIYDADGYRATLRCSCRKLQVEGRRLRGRYAEAEADAKVYGAGGDRSRE